MKGISYLLTLILMLSVSEVVWSQCVTTYTSTGAGNFATGSNWVGGITPPNPIPPGVTVTMNHAMNNNGTIENNGTLTAAVGSFTNNSGATYLGTGTFTGNFINNGMVSPGSTMVVAQLMTATVTAITGTTATSGGSICYDGGSSITAKGVCWNTSPLPTIALPTKTSDGMGTGTFTSNITGLSGLTTYYVRAYATNSTGTAYGNEITFTTIASCSSGTITHNTLTYGVVASAGGKCWLDRNLGATQVAISSTDAASYGDLFQWGRGADGHQLRTSANTALNATSSSDTPGHGNFIIVNAGNFDWRSPQNDNLWQGVSGVNNPCPGGYRLPTDVELDAERASWGTNNAAGAFASPLKLPLAGVRNVANGSLVVVGTSGYYWSGTVSGAFARHLLFDSSSASMGASSRAAGFSVRCIKDDSPAGAIGSLICPGATITGTLTSGVAASSVSSSVPYTGGNGGTHGGQTVTSTGVTGLTATLAAGSFANGAGNLSYGITGTPASAGTASFALNIGGQMCTLTRAVAPSVPNACNPSNPTAIVEVTNSFTGKTWMDRNLGANRAATSSTDDQSYGSLFQWGRGADGHQCVNRYAGDGVTASGTIATQSTTDTPGHGNFIIGFSDWRSTQNDNLWQGVSGVNNPCPSGYRLPTNVELDAERTSWAPNNNATGSFASPLKLPMAGDRSSSGGSLSNVGTSGRYWSSTVGSATARNLFFGSGSAGMSTLSRASGLSVRCLKEDGTAGAIGSINCGGATNTGTLTSGVAASGVSASVPYTGGNGGSHAGQTVTSTGVTGLTAYLYPGVFVSGPGSLIYTITGTPASAGTASFALNIGGQTCTLELTVAAITTLNCVSAVNTGTLTSGVLASGVSSSVPYSGGNGDSHGGQTVTSTGVTGLTATLAAGSFASGAGNLSYNISGTPASSGTASFALNIGGQMCTLTMPVGTLAIGASYQGGIVAYILQPGDPGYITGETHGLIAAPSDQSAGIQWYNGIYMLTGATGTALGTGQANTTAIVTSQGPGSYAAQMCDALGLNGYSDWYLPSKDELNKLYENRGAIGGFAICGYWSSTEIDNSNAWRQAFTTFGTQFNETKDFPSCVRAVRAF